MTKNVVLAGLIVVLAIDVSGMCITSLFFGAEKGQKMVSFGFRARKRGKWIQSGVCARKSAFYLPSTSRRRKRPSSRRPCSSFFLLLRKKNPAGTFNYFNPFLPLFLSTFLRKQLPLFLALLSLYGPLERNVCNEQERLQCAD
jgi:hypothetical protein